MNEAEDKRSAVTEELLRAVLESTADGILVVGKNGEVLSSNRRFADLWQIPEELLATRNDELLAMAR